MEFLEIIVWTCLGFVPTLGVGSLMLSEYDKIKHKDLPKTKIVKAS